MPGSRGYLWRLLVSDTNIFEIKRFENPDIDPLGVGPYFQLLGEFTLIFVALLMERLFSQCT
jgi:hypothetical protein